MTGIEYIRLFEIHPGVNHLFLQEAFPPPVVDRCAGAPKQFHSFWDLYQFIVRSSWLQLWDYPWSYFFSYLLDKLSFVNWWKDHVIHIQFSFGLLAEYGHKLAGVVSWGSTPSLWKQVFVAGMEGFEGKKIAWRQDAYWTDKKDPSSHWKRWLHSCTEPYQKFGNCKFETGRWRTWRKLYPIWALQKRKNNRSNISFNRWLLYCIFIRQKVNGKFKNYVHFNFQVTPPNCCNEKIFDVGNY